MVYPEKRMMRYPYVLPEPTYVREFLEKPIAFHRPLNALWKAFLILIVSVALVACSFGGRLGDLSSTEQKTLNQIQNIGAGAKKVGLLLPLNSAGDTRRVALALKQAAELALIEARTPAISLITKDTGGTAQGAAAAATAALNEGATLLIGPLLSAEVEAVKPIARARGVNMMAFSSLSSVASPNTFLMSFLPNADISTIIHYASSRGFRNFAGLFPNSSYGNVVQKSFTQAVTAAGASLAGIQNYNRGDNSVAASAGKIAANLKQSNSALLIADGGQPLHGIGISLSQNGIDPRLVKILGTSLWDDPNTRNAPIANASGWYAGVSPQLVTNFERKYAASYGTRPPRIASLGYDAVTLANVLARRGDFSTSALTNPEGFVGANGLFRFHTNGLIERGLAILQMTPEGATIVQPPPSRF